MRGSGTATARHKHCANNHELGSVVNSSTTRCDMSVRYRRKQGTRRGTREERVERDESGTNLLKPHHCGRHHLQVDAQQTVWSANNELSQARTGDIDNLTTRHKPESSPQRMKSEKRGGMGGPRVSLSARKNTGQPSRSNTKSGVVGGWKSGEECHWCSQLGALGHATVVPRQARTLEL